ncbi:hypothetical protein BGZ98_006713 [Dissophora globulifera]|nr:hypothetical protein BGZ98_006713 [Dissophora globulifera]
MPIPLLPVSNSIEALTALSEAPVDSDAGLQVTTFATPLERGHCCSHAAQGEPHVVSDGSPAVKLLATIEYRIPPPFLIDGREWSADSHSEDPFTSVKSSMLNIKNVRPPAYTRQDTRYENADDFGQSTLSKEYHRAIILGTSSASFNNAPPHPSVDLTKPLRRVFDRSSAQCITSSDSIIYTMDITKEARARPEEAVQILLDALDIFNNTAIDRGSQLVKVKAGSNAVDYQPPSS